LTGKKSFRSMRHNNFTNRKESLPVNGVVVSYWPEGFPFGHLGATPKSPQAWGVVWGANSQKFKKKIKHDWMADSQSWPSIWKNDSQSTSNHGIWESATKIWELFFPAPKLFLNLCSSFEYPYYV
jgi:hypothetical protein